MLPEQEEIKFEGAGFMQLLFNQASLRKDRRDFANAELRRTVRTILLQGAQKFPQQVSALRNVVKAHLNACSGISNPALTTLLSFVPEMALLKVSLGSTC